MLNEVPAQSFGRRPRGMVVINDIPINWVEFEVVNNNHYQADTFRIELPISEQDEALTPQFWATEAPLLVEIFAGFPNDPESYSNEDLKSLILGEVDELEFNPQTALITLSGRNLAARFIDNKTTEGFDNLTASQVATKLAERRGLNAFVITTTTKVGTFYSNTQSFSTYQHTEWDLLTFLANQENFSVFVNGNTLYFQPKAEPNDNPYVLQWQKTDEEYSYPRYNGKRLRLSRSLTMAKDVIVKVRSWNSKQKKPFTKVARSTRNKGSRRQPGIQEYSYIFPGLTAEQALQKAQQILRDITAHEVKLMAELPADNILTVDNIIQLAGTGTAFDQVYYVDSITRRMSLTEGYNMTIAAKNHSTESNILV